MIFSLDGIVLTQAEIDIVIAGLKFRAKRGGVADIRALDADSALQKFLAVQRKALLPTVKP